MYIACKIIRNELQIAMSNTRRMIFGRSLFNLKKLGTTQAVGKQNGEFPKSPNELLLPYVIGQKIFLFQGLGPFWSHWKTASDSRIDNFCFL